MIPVFAFLFLGCGRQTEALPIVQANTPPTQHGNPKELLNGEPMATIRTADVQFVTQDQEPKKNSEKGEGFSFPNDKGGKVVGDFLRPASKSLADEPGKKRLSGPAFLERPEIAAPIYKGLPPKVAIKDGGKPVRPKPAAEGIPLSGFFGDPQLPVVVKLQGTALVKWPMPDPNQPVPLPILAQPKSERAPLTDPTADASTDAALSGTIPVRDNPAPFLRVNLPDPFENRQTIKVRNPLPEDPTPQTR
jgi:hypothetical protein